AQSAWRPRALETHTNRDAEIVTHNPFTATPKKSQSAMKYGSVKSTLRKRMTPPPAEIGVPVAEVETPALIIDLDALDRNIAKMAEFARAAGVRVPPHAKT